MNQSINIDKNILLRRIHKRPEAYSDNNINSNNSSAEARYAYNMTHNNNSSSDIEGLSPKRRNPNKKRPKRHLKKHLKLPKSPPQRDNSTELMDTLATGPMKTKPKLNSTNNITNTIAITTAAIDEVEEENGHNYEGNQGEVVSEFKKRKKSLFEGIKGSIGNKVVPITTTTTAEEGDLAITPSAPASNGHKSDDADHSTTLTLPEPTIVTPDEADAGGGDVENAYVSTEVKAKPLVIIHSPRTHHIAIAPLTSPLKDPSPIALSDQLARHTEEQHQPVTESIAKESPREYDEAVVVTSHEGLNLSPRSDIAPLLDDLNTATTALEKGQTSERSFRSILKKPSSFNYGGASSPRGLRPERVSSTLSLLDPYLPSAESSRPSTQTSAVRPDSTHSPTRQHSPSLSTKRSLISKVSFHYTVPAPDTSNITTTATLEGGHPLTVPDTLILASDEPKPKNSVHHVRIAQFLESEKMLTLSHEQTGSDTNNDSNTNTNINSPNNSPNNSPTITTHKSLPPPLNPSPYTPPLGDTSAHTLVKSYEDPSKPLNHKNTEHVVYNSSIVSTDHSNTLLWQAQHSDDILENGLLKNTTHQKGHNSDSKANKYIQNNNNNADAYYDSDEDEEGSWGNSYDDSSSDDDNEVSLVYTHYITHC